METSNSTSSVTERLKDWRSELKGLDLTKDDRDELQSHMEDSLDELLAKGLSEDEAWIVAVHRIGEIRDIRNEFKKMHEGRIPAYVHVVFWLGLIFTVWQIVEISRRLIIYWVQVGEVTRLGLTGLITLLIVFGWFLYRRKSVKSKKGWEFFKTISPIVVLVITWGIIIPLDGPECRNSNNVLKNNPPRSEIYQVELLKLFTKTGTDNLYYRFAYAYSEYNKDYIVLNAIGKDFCGQFSLDVTNSKRMEYIVKTKGKGYGDSLWKGVKFDTFSDKLGTKFIFKSVETIVD